MQIYSTRRSGSRLFARATTRADAREIFARSTGKHIELSDIERPAIRYAQDILGTDATYDKVARDPHHDIRARDRAIASAARESYNNVADIDAQIVSAIDSLKDYFAEEIEGEHIELS